MTEILNAENSNHFKRVAHLAREIWTEHYTPIIGSEQVNYMLEKFQSESAIGQQVLDGTEYCLLVHDHKDAGYFSHYLKDKHLFLSKLYVAKSHRGLGIGKKALEAIIKRAQNFKCDKIELTVNKYNTNSIHAYEKMGFININSIVQDIGNGYVMDDYVMQKNI
ncbi:MAG: GNAT family N-acetyltransferase [Marinoscillum sp.]